jgi:hypothetical protein
MGTPEILWIRQSRVVGGSPSYFCVDSRDPDYPTNNVPFWMDCDAGTYVVYTSVDNRYSICDNDGVYRLTSGSLQNFRYKDKCLADSDHPITPHLKVTCAGQFTP